MSEAHSYAPGVRGAQLPGQVTDLLASSMAWMDALWDDEAALLWTVKRDRHMTRETAWYALGLLQRAAGDDVERAHRALHRVVDQQFDAPGAPFAGTFRRAPEEPDPPDDPVMWVHYDPNWRQFVGTTFAVTCDRFDLPSDLEDRMRGAVVRAVEGEPQGRVAPTYANIALMKAWLDTWAGRTDDGAAMGRAVAEAFDEHGAFLEYNSPTYYGIDLLALALWRTSSEPLSSLGPQIEAALWRDIARFYHAGLRNLCGPFDRAYGMDMTSYATPLGLWMWAELGVDRAPFPDPGRRFIHPHDFCFAPFVAALEASIPDDARPDLEAFQGERTIERTISVDPLRVATAWIAEDVMMGAHTGPPSGIGWYQHHHATIHWRREDGTVGWARLRSDVNADATATPGELRITTSAKTPIAFDVHPTATAVGGTWHFDGLRLSVETNAADPVLDSGGIVYEPATKATTFVIGFGS